MLQHSASCYSRCCRQTSSQRKPSCWSSLLTNVQPMSLILREERNCGTLSRAVRYALVVLRKDRCTGRYFTWTGPRFRFGSFKCCSTSALRKMQLPHEFVLHEVCRLNDITCRKLWAHHIGQDHQINSSHVFLLRLKAYCAVNSCCNPIHCRLVCAWSIMHMCSILARMNEPRQNTTKLQSNPNLWIEVVCGVYLCRKHSIMCHRTCRQRFNLKLEVVSSCQNSWWISVSDQNALIQYTEILSACHHRMNKVCVPTCHKTETWKLVMHAQCVVLQYLRTSWSHIMHMKTELACTAKLGR